MCKSFCISIYLSAVLFSTAAFAAPETAKKDQAAPKKQTQQPAKPQVKAKTQPVKKQAQAKAQKPVEKGVQKIFSGAITAIDAEKKTITVHVKSGDYPVMVEASTALVAGNDKISFADLKVGNRVSVKYLRFSNGSRKALSVNNKTFQAARAEKNAQEKKKAAALAAKKQKQTPVKKEAAAVKKVEKTAPPAKVAKKPAPPAKKVEKTAPPAKVAEKPAPPAKKAKKTAQTKQPKPDKAHEE